MGEVPRRDTPASKIAAKICHFPVSQCIFRSFLEIPAQYL